MMEEIDIVLQGPMSDYTVLVANTYLKLKSTRRIIISCWETCPIFNDLDNRILVIRSKDVPNRGIGNRNRQIKSSLVGVNYAETEYVIKLRTDMEVSLEGLEKWIAFVNLHIAPKNKYENGKGPYNQIFSAGNFSQFPFHPRDHVFIGNKLDLIDFFSIPYDENAPPEQENYRRYTRAETYIASFYCAKFDSNIYRFIENPLEYLVDDAPKRNEAMEVSRRILDSCITPLPKVSFEMPKIGLKGMSHYASSCGEYWS